MKLRKALPLLLLIVFSWPVEVKAKLDVTSQLDYCVEKTRTLLLRICDKDSLFMPKHVLHGEQQWSLVEATKENWVAGFWPGILWQVYGVTGDEKFKTQAERYTAALEYLSNQPAYDHDLGFVMFNSFGNGWKYGCESEYESVILRSARQLSKLFNPKVGTILSWPREVKPRDWPHNTIMDNMMNLELLYWASNHCDSPKERDYFQTIATRHAETTMANHFRKDGSCYHVAVYDTIDGHFIKGVTHQGYSDSSMWSRGQSWAIYGYTMVYRYTHDRRFLVHAQKVADIYLKRLAETSDDWIPFWDFDDPAISVRKPKEAVPKDASAACVTASALLELCQYVDIEKGRSYRQAAESMLESLSSERYQSGSANEAFLLHSTGHKPNNSEIDASLIYADYYYLEALIRLSVLYKQDGVDRWLQYVKEKPDWLVSRLQMYWTTHATDVFVRGEAFSHPGGERANVPTVKFNGTRSTASEYNRPSLENVVPYDDDEQGSVTFISRQTGKMEKTNPSKTGCNIASLNRQILTIARDALYIYRFTADSAYLNLCLPVFDTFMRGIAARNVPTDLNNGHQQTLVGMTTFEVIHEDAIMECVEMYNMCKQLKLQKSDWDVYDAAFKKWADNIIANGVPHNNWDIIQAKFIAKIASVLEDDSAYTDRRGRQFYLSCVTDKNSIRQWSMKKLADYGFDEGTGIWNESPGYSMNVVNDFAMMANDFDRDYGIDFFTSIPVLTKALKALPQYLFPNRMIAGFGDTHPGFIDQRGVKAWMKYLVRHGSQTDEAAKLMTAMRTDAPDSLAERYASRMFYAPRVSWAVLRSGMNPRHDLMASINGSLGNHQHANGISVELYGKGYVLAPDGGIGKDLYSGLDYAEYYSQFPAHNTVCVNGRSSYPVMMSNHAFEIVGKGEQEVGKGVMMEYVTMSFIEPETQTEQQRTIAVVKTSETGGYYVDIFRSRGDKFNDYFYHNLGQTMTLTASDGSALNLQPTEELAFAGGNLYAYSYIWNKQSVITSKDVKATFQIDNGPRMTMWMQGATERTVFSALSPVNMEYERLRNMPYNISKQPVLTFVARQQGEAWTRPFVAIIEPSDEREPSEIASVEFFKPKGKADVGILVKLKDGRSQRIVASDKGKFKITIE